MRRLVDQRRALHGRGVERHLVGPGAQDRLDVLERAQPSAHGERDEDAVGDGPNHAGDDVAAVRRRRDVEEHELVGALGVVARRGRHRVPGVAQVDEVRPLDHAAVPHVQARNDAPG